MKLTTNDEAKVIASSRPRVPQEDADSLYLLVRVALMSGKA